MNLEIKFERSELKLEPGDLALLRSLIGSDLWAVLLKIWQSEINALTLACVNADRAEVQLAQGRVQGLFHACECLRQLAARVTPAPGEPDPDVEFLSNQGKTRPVAYPS